MSRIIKFVKDWMLPLAIVMGVVSYLILFSVEALHTNVEPWFSELAKNIQPAFIAIMLSLQFNTVSPHDLRFRKWHFYLLAFQLVIFTALTLLVTVLPDGAGRILAECAMLCFICPTAAAAGVITRKLGGSLSDTISYVVLINITAAIVLPIAIPIVNSETGTTFLEGFLAICAKIFPLLVFPLLLAWIIRYTMRGVQRFLLRFTEWAFYCWGVALMFSIYLATEALMNSGISVWTAVMIGVVSMICTIVQFGVGKLAGKKANGSHNPDIILSDETSAGQALGQKNSGFLIWLGYSYLTPVTSVAGGLYSIWQNVINSLEIYRHDHLSKKTNK